MKIYFRYLIRILCFLFITFYLISPVYSYTSFQKYSNNPILLLGSAGSWDDYQVSAANVIYEGINDYKLWYYGTHILDRGSIGYAASVDGVQWNKNTSPIFQIDPNDPNEIEISSPKVIKVGSEYKMWYLSTISYPGQGNEMYRIKYASSPNGINNWIKAGIVFQRSGPSPAWDAEGVVPSTVMYLNGEYKMWYGGRDRNGVWRIGYAHSPNGITDWIREPSYVLAPSLTSDGNTVGAPSVIYDNASQTYHMYFHAGSQPTRICYATSTNASNWTRTQNCVLEKSTETSFDNFMITSPSIIKVNNTLFLYYSGSPNNYNWQIGLATDGPFPIPSPSPSPSPSQSPTPSPSYSPSPSPSPTPSPSSSPTPNLSPSPSPSPTPETKKVILVPGLAASWNADAIMNCKSGNYLGKWNIVPAIGTQIYQPVIDALTNANYNVIPYYYDWRLSINANGEHLEEFINQNTLPDERVHIIGHSMGGLVGRAYLEHTKIKHRIDKFMTIGSPHLGVPQAYYAWAGGEIVGELGWRIYGSFVTFMCGLNNPLANQRQLVRQYIPSTQNMLPIFEYLRYQNSPDYKPLEFMKNLNNWLPTHQFPPFYGAGVATLAGTDQLTMNDIVVRNPTRYETLQGNWLDGKPVKDEYVNEGDGTVLLKSSEMEADKNFRLSLNHSQIINDPSAILQIINYLKDSEGNTASFNISDNYLSSEKPVLAVISNQAVLKAIKPDGAVVKDQNGVIVISDTESGDYSLNIRPVKWNSKVYIGQFLPSGEIKWKEYGFSNPLPKSRTLKFNSTKITENILQ